MDEYKILKEYEEAKQNGTLSEMPDELDRKCRELIDEAFGTSRRKSFTKRISSTITRAAVVVLVLLGLSTVTVLCVDAFRIPVLNILLDNSGRYGAVVLGPNIQAEAVATASVAERFESSIPAAYRLVSREFHDAHGAVTYMNDDGYLICLIYNSDQNGINVDAENAEYTPVEFGDYYGLFREKDGYGLMWLDSENGIIYQLWANGMDTSEFWKLAYALIA